MRPEALDQFRARLKRREQPVVVDIWAPWCMPCRVMAPLLEQTARAFQGRVEVWKIDADEQPELVRALGVYGIPTLVVFHGDREVTRRSGVQSPATLTALFEAALTGEAPARGTLAPTDRLLRLVAGAVLGLVGMLSGPSLLLLAVGGLILFSAVYDRCPLWRAITAQYHSRSQP